MVNASNDFKVGKGDQLTGDGSKTYDVYATAGTVTAGLEGYIT